MKQQQPSSTTRENTTVPRPCNIAHHTVLGHRVRVAIWPGEDKSKLPLLLFNGIGAGLELITPFVDALDPSIEVIAFDVPGTGGSPAPRLPYRMWMLSSLASRLVRSLGHERVDAMGVSWGGALAQQFALQNPRLCRGLILAATSQGMLMVPGKLSVLGALMSPRRYNDPDYRHKIFGMIYGGAAAKDPSLMTRFSRFMRPTSPKGYLLQQLAIMGWTSLPWLRLVKQPTLVMAGDDDPVIPLVNARLLARLIPNARLQVMHDGHIFLLSDSGNCAALVGDFLDSAAA
jgi:poly(3-hydroxyalkanoate) depolymerase